MEGGSAGDSALDLVEANVEDWFFAVGLEFLAGEFEADFLFYFLLGWHDELIFELANLVCISDLCCKFAPCLEVKEKVSKRNI